MVPKPALVSWLFAVWWGIVAIRDATNSRSPRYGNGPAILIAFIAAGTLVWLGFQLRNGPTGKTPPALIAFAVCFVLWVLFSLGGRSRR